MSQTELPLTPTLLARCEEGARRVAESSEVLIERLEPLWREYAALVARLPAKGYPDPGVWPTHDVRFTYLRADNDLRYVMASGYVECEDEPEPYESSALRSARAFLPRFICFSADHAKCGMQELRLKADALDYARSREIEIEANERATLARLYAKYGAPTPAEPTSLADALLYPLDQRDRRD